MLYSYLLLYVLFKFYSFDFSCICYGFKVVVYCIYVILHIVHQPIIMHSRYFIIFRLYLGKCHSQLRKTGCYSKEIFHKSAKADMYM